MGGKKKGGFKTYLKEIKQNSSSNLKRNDFPTRKRKGNISSQEGLKLQRIDQEVSFFEHKIKSETGWTNPAQKIKISRRASDESRLKGGNNWQDN